MWQAVGAVVGAVCAVLALLVSAAAFYVAVAGTRVSQLVVRWHADRRLTLENRGPATAKKIQLTLRHQPRRDVDSDSDVESPSEPRRSKTIDVLPAGFVYEDRAERLFMQVDHTVELTWRDGRLLRQRYVVPLRQEAAPFDSSRPLLTDRQVTEVAERLGAGIGAAFRDELNNIVRRRRRDL